MSAQDRAEQEAPLKSIQDSCVYLATYPNQLYDLIATGEIVAIKRGRRTFVLTASMDAYLERLPRLTVKPSKRARAAMAKAAALKPYVRKTRDIGFVPPPNAA